METAEPFTAGSLGTIEDTVQSSGEVSAGLRRIADRREARVMPESKYSISGSFRRQNFRYVSAYG